ncbi:hypothetical protein [Rhizobium sp. 21-4511-3d]
MSADPDDNPSSPIPILATAVLDTFFENLANNDQFSEFAPKLRKLVVEDGLMAEPAIMALLFPEEP